MSDPKDDPIDIYEYLQFFPNPDGSVTRKLDRFPIAPPTPDPTSTTSVLSKDIPINHSKATFARLYLPRTAVDHHSPTKTLPLIIFIHGGGFILFRVDSVITHNFCSAMALQLPAVVASVGYRLAPEHRLPAAYDDAVEAIHWLRTTDEAWLRDYADFSNCFVMGSSAGGNIAYHAGLRVADQEDALESLMKITGLILLQPFFGGAQRTESELRLKKNPVLPLAVSDFMWDLALPAGKTDRDHEYCNPTVGGGSQSKSSLEKMKTMGWKVLVSGCEGDPLIDRQVEVARMMEETRGIEVKGIFGKGGFHGLEMVDRSASAALFAAIKDFIQKR